MANDQASEPTDCESEAGLLDFWKPRDDKAESIPATAFEGEFLELSKILLLSDIAKHDDQRSKADTAVVEAKECGPLISPDWQDKFGPGGRYGLGRDCYSECVRPPMTFKDLARRLTLQRRAMLFWTVVYDAFDIIPIADQFLTMQASIDRTLSRYDGRNGDRLIERLVQCSDRKFLRCLRAVMVDTGLPKTICCEEEEDNESFDPFIYRDDDGSPFLCTIPYVALGCPKDGAVRTIESLSPLESNWGLPRETVAASRSLVQKAREPLPLETYEFLEKAYVSKFFGPRRRHFAPNHLRAPKQRLTNSVIYKEYQQTRRSHLRGNTWIVDGEDFISTLSNAPGCWNEDGGLRRVELVFSLRDACYACLNKVHDGLTPVGWNLVLWGQEQLEWDVLKVLDRHWYNCNLVHDDIVAEWRLLFNILAAMRLEYMSLDFSEAHDLSGHFIGLEVVRSFDDFKYGIPAELTVEAPTKELADRIREIVITPKELPTATQDRW